MTIAAVLATVPTAVAILDLATVTCMTDITNSHHCSTVHYPPVARRTGNTLRTLTTVAPLHLYTQRCHCNQIPLFPCKRDPRASNVPIATSLLPQTCASPTATVIDDVTKSVFVRLFIRPFAAVLSLRLPVRLPVYSLLTIVSKISYYFRYHRRPDRMDGLRWILYKLAIFI